MTTHLKTPSPSRGGGGWEWVDYDWLASSGFHPPPPNLPLEGEELRKAILKMEGKGS